MLKFEFLCFCECVCMCVVWFGCVWVGMREDVLVSGCMYVYLGAWVCCCIYHSKLYSDSRQLKYGCVSKCVGAPVCVFRKFFGVAERTSIAPTAVSTTRAINSL